jgi:NAD(P)H-hydrate epimerase
VKQCNDLDIPVLTELPSVSEDSSTAAESTAKQRCPHFGDYDIIVDALFGFSFHGPPKEPFAAMISKMATTKTPVLSVDIPSGK